MELPKNIDFKILKGWHDTTTQPEKDPIKIIAKKDLRKVAGGLYRIRDDYTSVWSMYDEDGRSYIVRADDESGDKMIVADDQESSGTKTAYRMFIAGDVHIVWECDECDSPNIVKQGETYECDNCHHKTPDVLQQDGPQQAGVTSEEAIALYGPEVGVFMKKYAINRIDKVLLEQWAAANPASRKTASVCVQCGENIMGGDSPGVLHHQTSDGDVDHDADADHVPYKDDKSKSASYNKLAVEKKCEKCGEETGGTKLCLSCSPKGTWFKDDRESKSASYNKCQSCGHDFAGKYRETCPNCDSPEVKHHAVRVGNQKLAARDMYERSWDEEWKEWAEERKKEKKEKEEKKEKTKTIEANQSGEKCPGCGETRDEDDLCGCSMDPSDSAEKPWKEDFNG